MNFFSLNLAFKYFDLLQRDKRRPEKEDQNIFHPRIRNNKN